ncbi:hypothetical protein M885DRAFT_89176 [Pelagophyceae sp. CCMP2097]|nr:hypothetical protein M885DRAFT_89176 [Pelagophyceae sp. CCMP2097]
MAELPGGAWASLGNEFRLLSDEPAVAPYYRPMHRAAVSVAGGALRSRTVSQLRYVALAPQRSLLRPLIISLEGWRLIKEEKAALLATTVDDGGGFVSALEISTKLRSRMYVYNATGRPAPAQLDDGPRCAEINAAAYDLALAAASPRARKRFMQSGRPLVILPKATQAKRRALVDLGVPRLSDAPCVAPGFRGVDHGA